MWLLDWLTDWLISGMFLDSITPKSCIHHTVTGSPMLGEWPSLSRCLQYPDMSPSSSWMTCTWGWPSSRWGLVSSRFQASQTKDTAAGRETSITSPSTTLPSGRWFPAAPDPRSSKHLDHPSTLKTLLLLLKLQSSLSPPLRLLLPLKRILLLRLIPTLRLDPYLPYLSINLVLLLYLAPLGNPALLINIHFRLVFLIRFGFLFSILHLQV